MASKRQFLGSTLPALLLDSEWLEHMSTCAHCLAHPFDLCSESRRLWREAHAGDPVTAPGRNGAHRSAVPATTDWRALAERAAGALAPFANIGGLLFASAVADSDAMVEVRLANGQALGLSRTAFKSAYDVACAIRMAAK